MAAVGFDRLSVVLAGCRVGRVGVERPARIGDDTAAFGVGVAAQQDAFSWGDPAAVSPLASFKGGHTAAHEDTHVTLECLSGAKV